MFIPFSDAFESQLGLLVIIMSRATEVLTTICRVSFASRNRDPLLYRAAAAESMPR